MTTTNEKRHPQRSGSKTEEEEHQGCELEREARTMQETTHTHTENPVSTGNGEYPELLTAGGETRLNSVVFVGTFLFISEPLHQVSFTKSLIPN